MNCRKYRKLIDGYLEGSITDAGLAELRGHADRCPNCKEELRELRAVEHAVKEAMISPTAPVEAQDAVLSRLDSVEEPSRGLASATRPLVPVAWRAVAAACLVGVGLLIGIHLSPATPEAGGGEPGRAVPVRIVGGEGTVLLRHREADVWKQAGPGTALHVGDTLQCAGKSHLVLSMEDGSTLRLEESGTLLLKEHDGHLAAVLEHGTLHVTLKEQHIPFVVLSPQGRVEALGTEFTVSVR